MVFKYFLYHFLPPLERKKADKGGGSAVEVKDQALNTKQQKKEKTSKAERRALQEAQRAAKAAAKGVY